MYMVRDNQATSYPRLLHPPTAEERKTCRENEGRKILTNAVAPIYQSTRRHIQEVGNVHCHCRERFEYNIQQYCDSRLNTLCEFRRSCL